MAVFAKTALLFRLDYLATSPPSTMALKLTFQWQLCANPCGTAILTQVVRFVLLYTPRRIRGPTGS